MTYPAFFTDPRRHCHGSTLMWPEDKRGVAIAIAICQPPGKKPCPFVDECLEYAVKNAELHGVWGGQSMRKRVVMRRKPVEHDIPKPAREQNKPVCRKRLSFVTEAAAWKVSPNHWPYECPACGMWHLSIKRRAA